MFCRTRSQFSQTCLLLMLQFGGTAVCQSAPPVASPAPALFARDNLMAWCIVPFDGQRRGPEARALMLKGLGIEQLAYDYRNEHIPTFDAELEAWPDMASG